jgi:hypothetical protein
MSFIKLNHNLLRTLMKKSLLRPVDLAKRMRIQRQMVNYIIHHGGVKYANDLAAIFNCKRSDLLVHEERRVRVPRGMTVVNGKVRKNR